MKPFLLLTSMLAVLVSACFNARAQESFAAHETEYKSARQLILDGHVKDGIGQLAALLSKIDPSKEPNNYWSLGITLSDFLHQIQGYQDESTVLSLLASKKLHVSNLIMTQQIQLRAGRNLAFTGHANEAEKLLREVTSGDARMVHNPIQREAARILSQIELDRDNVSQSAIWMRRAVIGALVDKGCSSEEIVDTLSDYATYLRRTRRIFESHDLLTKLIPTYDQTFPHLSPKYLHFVGEVLESDRAVGNFAAAGAIYKLLKNNVEKVDLVAPSIRAQLFYHDLYSDAANSPPEGNPDLANRLKKLAADYPDWINKPDSRIIFSYFSLLAGDLDQAKSYATGNSDEPENTRIAAYELIIKSYISARRDEFSDSSRLLDDALKKINLYHHEFLDESPSKLPAISFEERAVLTAILARLAPNVASSPQQADSAFRLEQFLNRDKAKLSLSAKVARQYASSELQKEDIRTKDRLKDLRERLMMEAVNQLLTRTQPIKPYAPSKSNDYAFLFRLEEIEAKISTVDASIREFLPELEAQPNERTLSLEETKRLLKPDEAIISHVLMPGQGLVISCVTSEGYQFEINRLSPSDLKQLIVDDKILSAALRSINEPSPELDSSYPAESAFRLYKATLGPVEACFSKKPAIFLATDADLFSTPWNALLTELDTNKPFRHKTAAWVVRSRAISLLPSVGSLAQLRLGMPGTSANEKFLGIGDPTFDGHPDNSAQIELAQLIGTRGVGSKEEIRKLPRLPEAAVELRKEAAILGAKPTDLLLGANASEREFRSRALENYKIISFATHALVAGEIDSFAEPALVLSPSEEESNPKNDGVLTSTEIADLALDANLVILSACNTAAPDGRINSRGLSGLADAFFFAGARSVAVTQWAVYSDAAEHIGSGMVSLIAKNRDLGVAKALRETALEFIASASEDYMAHPRFWAAFIIAGDGSVAPLGQNPGHGSSSGKIRVDQEMKLELREQADLLDLTQTQNQTNYAIGMAKPLPGEKRFGSYTLEIGTDGLPKMIDLDRDMAASRVFNLENAVGVTGFYPATCKNCPQGEGRSAAVFKLMDRDGHNLWTVIRESGTSRFGAEIIKTPNGYALISFETNYASDHKSSIWLTSVSSNGVILKEKQIELPFILPRLSKGATINQSGDLIFAVTGEYAASETQRTPIKTNPLTGTKTYFCPASVSSLIFLVDLQTFAVKQAIETNDEAIIRFRVIDGNFFSITNTSKDCKLTKNIRVTEVDLSTKSIKPIFQTNTVNSVEAEDFEVTSERFIIVGRVSVFLPPILVRPTMSLEQLNNYSKQDFLNDSIFDASDSIMNALILVIRRDGTLLGDKVIHDPRSGSLQSLATRGDRRYLGIGAALGGKGWIIQFSELTE